MNRPTFLEGVIVALGASIAGASVYLPLALMLGKGDGFRATIGLVGLGYAVYLMYRSNRRVGRVTAMTIWLAFAGAAWTLVPGIAAYLIAHALLAGVLRSLFHHTGPLPSLADLGLAILGVAAGLWAFSESASLWLGLWCFFLVQALFPSIPHRSRGPREGRPRESTPNERFSRAQMLAEAALREISSNH